MTLVLLDEMNLANIEQYFASFLSKLETRRDCLDNNVPKIDLPLGAGASFALKLGKNVLWTGTMNEDETTKTLSDKVLDRGIVINFPRPKKFVPYKQMALGEGVPLLRRATWEGWINGANEFSSEEIGRYQSKVQEINETIGKVGRSLGQRVWNSIACYMAMYPIANNASDKERATAMDHAFEDQIVQKIMPKLRGLETAGNQGEALDKVASIIPETLREDFENACNDSFGQFKWITSGYLNDEA